MRLVPFNMFKPSSDFFLLTIPRWCFFVDPFCYNVSYAVVSVYCSLMITCGERDDLLALLCVVFFCVLSLSHMMFQVRYVLDCIHSWPRGYKT